MPSPAASRSLSSLFLHSRGQKKGINPSGKESRCASLRVPSSGKSGMGVSMEICGAKQEQRGEAEVGAEAAPLELGGLCSEPFPSQGPA